MLRRSSLGGTPSAASIRGLGPGHAAGIAAAVALLGASGLLGWSCVVAGDAAGDVCARTTDRFELRVTRPDGSTLDCLAADRDGGSPVVEIVDGRIVDATPDTFTLDACAPGAGCMQQLHTFEVHAAGLVLRLAKGMPVRVRHAISNGWGCLQDLMVTALPGWGDAPGAHGAEAGLLLAASDGGGSLDAAPFTVDRRAMGCRSERTCGAPPVADEFRLAFRAAAFPDVVVEVRMGETRDFSVDAASKERPLRVHNLRSFQTTLCDDYGNWAYWLAPPA